MARDAGALTLPGDHAVTAETLDAYIERADAPPALRAIVSALVAAQPPIADRLALGHLPGDPAEIVGTNDSGDAQKALDMATHHRMADVARAAGVRHLLSEEAEEVIVLNPDGAYDLAIDPIDGSGSIGIGAPLGMLFSILPAAPEGFLRPGRAIVAAGYASFGHSVDFGFSMGDGVTIATLDRATGHFHIAHERVTLPAATRTIAYNASNERHWSPGLQGWAADMRAGKDGPRGKDFNMRWLAAAVGELHRILLKGGMFIYPADARPGYENGRLRLVYEAGPIAYLMEQAGGRATDGTRDILDRPAIALHENTPLIFGVTGEVDIATRAYTG